MIGIGRGSPRLWIGERGEKIAAVAIVVAAVGGTLYLLNDREPLDLAFMADRWDTLFGPAALSLFITGISYATGMGIGFLLGWLRTVKARIPRGGATIWIEAIRGTPLFAQLLLLFALLSFYNPGRLPTDARLFLTGFLALTINTSAYQAEIFRAGLQSVHATQVEAARSIGLSYWGSMRHVILPQAIRIVVPPLTNEFIAMLKASALLFVIGISELTYAGRILSFGGNLVETYIMMTTLYLSVTIPLGVAVVELEKRFRIPGLGLQREPQGRAGRRATRS